VLVRVAHECQELDALLGGPHAGQQFVLFVSERSLEAAFELVRALGDDGVALAVHLFDVEVELILDFDDWLICIIRGVCVVSRGVGFSSNEFELLVVVGVIAIIVGDLDVCLGIVGAVGRLGCGAVLAALLPQCSKQTASRSGAV